MTKEERLKKQLEGQMSYYWARLNSDDIDLWIYCQELLNVIEAEKRDCLYCG